MTQTERLAELDKAGEALRAFGEPEISLKLRSTFPSLGEFTVGLKTAGERYGCDCFGHGATPAEALLAAQAARAGKSEEDAIRERHRAEAERRADEEIAALNRRDIAA